MLEFVYRERIGDREQAGVRCPRCQRVVIVEWTDDERASVDAGGAPLRLGRCDACFCHPGDELDPEGGYVYVRLEPGGRLGVGTSAYDYCEDLQVLVTGVASCGCCHVSLVRCGWCATPVPTNHPALESVDRYLDCGYCVHCDRIVGIDLLSRDGRMVPVFVDRVAAPEERDEERWRLWQERLSAEMDDVSGWSTRLREIPERELELIDLPEEAIEFVSQQPRMTWESWLEAFGRDLPPGVRGRP